MDLNKRQELMQKIIEKAWEDDAFKQELIANPISVIKELTGQSINLPEGKTLIIKDQTDNSVVYINIPAKLNLDDMELNDEQLETVAGGTDENNGFTWEQFVYIMTNGW